MNLKTKEALVAYLKQFVTPHKKSLIQQNIDLRTRHLTVMLENIYQPHNASAVLRSCDCFGIQDAHIVEDVNEYRINPEVAMGATKWLTLHRYKEPDVDNTAHCINQLKESGYILAATSLREGGISLLDCPIDKKIALCFGTEEYGLSDFVHDQADMLIKIPMYGFTQSYNISVSAALCLHELSHKLRDSDLTWRMQGEERLDLLVDWLIKATTHGNALARQFFRDNKMDIPEQFWEPEEEPEE